MKIATITLLSVSILASLLGLGHLRSEGAEQRYFEALREVDQALAKNSSEEVQMAFAKMRVTEKTLDGQRGIGRALVWISVSAAGLALASTLMSRTKKEPIQPFETTRGK